MLDDRRTESQPEPSDGRQCLTSRGGKQVLWHTVGLYNGHFLPFFYRDFALTDGLVSV